MELAFNLVLVDSDTRRRAAISHALSTSRIHVEPFESITELTQSWPRSGFILLHHEGQVIARLVDAMADHGEWFPIIAFCEAPEPERIVEAVLDGAIEESLRLEPAAVRVDRYATRDVEIGSPVSSILNLGANATLVMTLGDVDQVFVRGRVAEADIGHWNDAADAEINDDLADILKARLADVVVLADLDLDGRVGQSARDLGQQPSVDEDGARSAFHALVEYCGLGHVLLTKVTHGEYAYDFI
mgnify:CR=1 FL=1